MKNVLHVIPTGSNEPVHTASEQCSCQPLEEYRNLFIHNSLYYKEKFHRADSIGGNLKWVHVYEKLT